MNTWVTAGKYIILVSCRPAGGMAWHGWWGQDVAWHDMACMAMCRIPWHGMACRWVTFMSSVKAGKAAMLRRREGQVGGRQPRWSAATP